VKEERNIFESFSSLSGINIDDLLSIDRLNELDSQFKLSNEKYMKEFEAQIRQHQRAIEKLNSSNVDFMNASLSMLGMSNIE